MKEGFVIPPDINFHFRVRNDRLETENPYEWVTHTSWELFYKTRSVVFSLPGAFTPTCSTYQLPDFEKLHKEMAHCGVVNIWCSSVNDAFVMNKWKEQQNIKRVQMLPDGNGHLCDALGMLVDKSHLGMGKRSWRWAAVIDEGVVEKWFEEPGINNEGDDNDPYGETSPVKVLEYLKSKVKT